MTRSETDHLDEVALLAVRDDVSALDPSAVRHLEACAACRDELEGLRLRSSLVSGALASLDVSWDIEAARARVREAVSVATAEAAGARPIPLARRSWGGGRRAAAVVVLLAATASALPGSPVRQWLQGRGDATSVTEAIEAPRESTGPSIPGPESAVAEWSGIRLDASAPLRVSVRGLRAGEEVRVRWTDGDEVAVLAPAGSRFTSADGEVEAVVSAGPVTVEVPRGGARATLIVGGTVYLRSGPGAPEVTGPVVSESDAGVTFRVR